MNSEEKVYSIDEAYNIALLFDIFIQGFKEHNLPLLAEKCEQEKKKFLEQFKMQEGVNGDTASQE